VKKTPKTLGEARQVMRRGGLDELVGDPFAGAPSNETAKQGYQRLPGPTPRKPRVYAEPLEHDSWPAKRRPRAFREE